MDENEIVCHDPARSTLFLGSAVENCLELLISYMEKQSKRCPFNGHAGSVIYAST